MDLGFPAGKWITMSNALTRAGHGLTLAEKRIITSALAKIDSRKTVRPGEILTTQISAVEYAELFQVDPDTAYSQLASGARALYKRSITFYEPAFKRKGKSVEPTLVQMRWVGSVKYQKGEGWVELHWWPALLGHLTGLQRQFTTYQLQQASAMRSIYSWRLLELLMRFESTGWAEYTVEDFAVSMEATEKQQANFNNIKRRIIEPAIKELTQKDGWMIEWKPIKKGRRVASVRFEFQRNPQPPLF